MNMSFLNNNVPGLYSTDSTQRKSTALEVHFPTGFILIVGTKEIIFTKENRK